MANRVNRELRTKFWGDHVWYSRILACGLCASETDMAFFCADELKVVLNKLHWRSRLICLRATRFAIAIAGCIFFARV